MYDNVFAYKYCSFILGTHLVPINMKLLVKCLAYKINYRHLKPILLTGDTSLRGATGPSSLRCANSVGAYNPRVETTINQTTQGIIRVCAQD